MTDSAGAHAMSAPVRRQRPPVGGPDDAFPHGIEIANERRGRGIVACVTRRGRPLAFHVVAVVLFLVFVAAHFDVRTGFTRFIYFGDRFDATRLARIDATHPFVHVGSAGYDGQFYAQVAVTPLLADQALGAALDSPAYRARRIGMPWLAWLAGLGHVPWVLQAYALVNVVAWLALVALLLRWIPPGNATSLLAWLGCAFGIGVMMSVERALTDLPSTLCIAGAIGLAESARRPGAGAAFAFGVLTRDTSLLAGVLLLPTDRSGRAEWLRSALTATVAVAPWFLWSLVVQRRFPGTPGVDAANFAWPFTAMGAGIAAAWHAVPRAGVAAFVIQLLCVSGLSIQCAFLALSARAQWRSAWWRVGAAFALLFALLGPAVWLDPAAAARAVIPMTLAFNILLPRDRGWSLPACALGNLPMLCGLHVLLAPIWTPLL